MEAKSRAGKWPRPRARQEDGGETGGILERFAKWHERKKV
jgi:hypothetical protein